MAERCNSTETSTGTPCTHLVSDADDHCAAGHRHQRNAAGRGVLRRLSRASIQFIRSGTLPPLSGPGAAFDHESLIGGAGGQLDLQMQAWERGDSWGAPWETGTRAEQLAAASERRAADEARLAAAGLPPRDRTPYPSVA
jgi:hypothetical protein